MPRIIVDLARIEHNTRLVAELLKPHGIRLVGVTKACQGDGLVAEAMLAGGAAALADSRVENLARLRPLFPGTELQLLRVPAPGGATVADLYFVSSADQAAFLPAPGGATSSRVMLFIEAGDSREGVPAHLAVNEALRLDGLQGVELAGLAATIGCARLPISPGTAFKYFLEAAAAVSREVKQATATAAAAESPGPAAAGSPPLILSAGGSNLLSVLLESDNEVGDSVGLGMAGDLRCGEAILLGRVPAAGTAALFLPGAHTDAFTIEAPVLEVFEKGGARQALVGLGIQDSGLAPVMPRGEGIIARKVTSDYMVVTLTEDVREPPVRVGDNLQFTPTYYSLQTAMASPFVEKAFL